MTVRFLGWILVGLVVYRVGAWVLAGAGHAFGAVGGVLVDVGMDVVVFAAWTAAVVAALTLFGALVRGIAELRDRRSRKRWATRQTRPVAVSPCPAPEEVAPAPASTPAPPYGDPGAEPADDLPVLGRPAYLHEVSELLDDLAARRPDGDDEPVFESGLMELPDEAPGFGESDRDAPPVIEWSPRAWRYDGFGHDGSGEDGVGLGAPIAHRASPPLNTVSEDSPIFDWLSGPVVVPERSSLDGGSVPTSPALLVLACRGVQIGDDNAQFNTYTYELQDPTVDFAEVLRRPAVSDALTRLIMDPENTDLRAQAIKALCAGEWRFVKRELLDLGPTGRESPTVDVARELDAVPGFITVHGCQGVQLGNRSRQRNDFVYVCRRATVDTFSLLESHPEVANCLIDAVVSRSRNEWKEAGRTLNTALRAALNSPNSLDAIPDRSFTVRSRSAGVVRDRDGVSIGERCSTVDVKAVVVGHSRRDRLTKSVLSGSERLRDRATAWIRRGSEPPAPPAPPSAPSPSRPPSPTTPFSPSAYEPPPASPPRVPRSVTSTRDGDGHWPLPPLPSPNRRPEPPSGPESPSSGRGLSI
ncbi:RIP homotypic interaction motif-containing protein [Streptomyces sp. NPDC090106]|uniref:RIP homotypic interaction motif-containing protein n=1 Tax=Streptomyces sp. NPDC090106 TaxID=3365946 RepID=UPI003815A855